MTLGQLVMNCQHAGSDTVSNRCINSDRIFTNMLGMVTYMFIHIATSLIVLLTIFCFKKTETGHVFIKTFCMELLHSKLLKVFVVPLSEFDVCFPMLV